MTSLIGLHGSAPQAGKDTAFSVIEAWSRGRGVRAVRRGFADDLKISGLLALGIITDYPKTEGERSYVIGLADALKLHGSIRAEVWDHEAQNQAQLRWGHTISGRDFWREYGTAAHRDMFGHNFWVDNLLATTGELVTGPNSTRWIPDVRQEFADSHHWVQKFWSSDGTWVDYAVITDVRFPNEAERIRDLGGVVVYIQNDWAEAELQKELERTGKELHISDLKLDDKYIDTVIENNGTLREFQDAVGRYMTSNYGE